MSRTEDSRHREQRKPTLHIATSRHRPHFSPIAEEHESENARPFSNSPSYHRTMPGELQDGAARHRRQ
jgi:hypothetical protein